MKQIILLALKTYRGILSPFFGYRCRFHPSCSTYASQAIDQKGVSHGLILAVRRLVRCHPFHSGGYDPVPSSKVS